MSAKDYKHLYDSRQWREGRRNFLTEHPLCYLCLEAKRYVPSQVVDHHIPHKGDPELFFDVSNWRAMCKRCHDSLKARAERTTGVIAGCDALGQPLDRSHHWYRT